MSKSDLKVSKKRRSEDAPVEATTEVEAPVEVKAKKSKKSKKAATEEDVDETATAPEPAEVDPTEEKEDTKETIEGDDAPEPEVIALSHKALRLAKRRKLAGLDPLPVPSSLPITTPSDPSSVPIGQTPAKSAHGIWVGNLSFKTTGKVLLEWFGERGLKEVTRLNLPSGKRAHEANRGFAYLDFPTATDVEIAVGLSEQHLEGRKLLIKSSVDYTGRPTTTTSTTLPEGATLNKTARKILNSQKNSAGPTLFMGNLGFETKVEDIRNMFDRNQKASAAWEKGGKGKGKEEGDAEDGEKSDEDEDEAEEKDEDRDDDDSDSDPASEDEEEEDDGEKKIKKKSRGEKGPKGPRDLSKAKDAGIRKIRLGTFEDTGKCKGWAFIDFHLPEQCTRALLNVHNHTLNGRSLVLEYASAEAVRRGQVGTKAARGGGGGGRGGRGAAARERGNAAGGAGNKRGRDWDDGDMLESARSAVQDDNAGGEAEGRSERRPYSTGAARGGRGGGNAGNGAGRPQPQGRAKPGAALASAQRASEAIVESRGKKITF